MSAKEQYMSQVRRLAGLEFYPAVEEACVELAKVLKKKTKNIEHARRVVDRFMEPGAPSRCPLPGDLAMMAKSVPENPEHDRPELPDPCDECRPYGGTHRLVTRNGFEAMDRCSCPRGQKLRSISGASTPKPPQRSRLTSAGDIKLRASGDSK